MALENKDVEQRQNSADEKKGHGDARLGQRRVDVGTRKT